MTELRDTDQRHGSSKDLKMWKTSCCYPLYLSQFIEKTILNDELRKSVNMYNFGGSPTTLNRGGVVDISISSVNEYYSSPTSSTRFCNARSIKQKALEMKFRIRSSSLDKDRIRIVYLDQYDYWPQSIASNASNASNDSLSEGKCLPSAVEVGTICYSTDSLKKSRMILYPKETYQMKN